MLWITPRQKWFLIPLWHLSTEHTHFCSFLTLKLNISKQNWFQNRTILWPVCPTHWAIPNSCKKAPWNFLQWGKVQLSTLHQERTWKILPSVAPAREIIHEQSYFAKVQLVVHDAWCILTLCDLLPVTAGHSMDTWQSRLPSTRKSHQKL